MSIALTFLFVPADATGHFNACLGLAEQLRDRGHRVVFATPNDWKGKLEPQGFIEECYLTAEPVPEDQKGEKYNDTWGELIAKIAPTLAMSSEDQITSLMAPMSRLGLDQAKYSEPRLKEIVTKVKPDAIILDWFVQSPSLTESGVPWILIQSFTPSGICLKSEKVPPFGSGYPIDGDRAEWRKFAEKRSNAMQPFYEEARKWIIEGGGPELDWPKLTLINDSPYANIYMYPLELDYISFRPNPPNWHRFEAFVRGTKSQETFEIPTELQNKPGNLVYFSIGTIGCGDLVVMKRLIGFLAKSPHRFIISKGPLGDQLTLAENMWGANSVPQTKVIPLVDLVITHGGNNTITESFYFGKRVLVLPLFGDQKDNGQRVYETGLGLQFRPYEVTDTELVSAIDFLLKDELLERRMKSIGQRIRATNSQASAADLIENVAKKYRKL